MILIPISIRIGMQVLREFNHVNPQDDDEGKEFSDTRVRIKKDFD